MRQWKVWTAAVALLFLGAGRAPHLSESSRFAIPDRVSKPWRAALREAYQAGQKQDYAATLASLAPARDFARAHPGDKLAALTWLYEGNALAAQLRFAAAMNAYAAARTSAVSCGDRELVAASALNLSSIYTALISQDEAHQWAESLGRDFARLGPNRGDDWLHVPALLQRARALSRAGDRTGAFGLFREALLSASLSGQPNLEAATLERMGVELFLAKDLDGAEDALSSAFRIRRLSKGNAVSAARGLANVLLARGKPAEALTMANLALRAASGGQAGYLHFWSCLRTRALALWDLGRKDEAIAELRRAASAPHLRQLPADSLRVATVSGWHGLFELLVDLTARRYFETRDRSHLLDALAAAEADRAFALRQASPSADPSPARASLLAQYQDLYRRLYASDTPESRQKLRDLRLRLAAAEGSEGQTGPVSDPTPDALGALAPGPNQTIVVFYAVEDRLYRWSRVHGGNWNLDVLPSPAPVFQAAREYTAHLARGEWRAPLASSLYRDLFGSLDPAAASQPEWLIVPDDELFRLPFATLSPDGRTYLLDTRAVQVLPGAWALHPGASAEPQSQLWAGLGDPIYNAGDPRISDTLAGAKRGVDPGPDFQLARLPGSARELAAAAGAWTGESRSLTGERATAQALDAAIRQRPAVLHLATHVLPAPDNEQESILALSLDPSGTPEFIGPAWISGRRLPGTLVVMSGCRSGSGQVRPGEGLLGLTRAWLYAGASGVVATHWPLIDDSGEFWENFYRSWGDGSSPAIALRRAQLWLRSQSRWQANPAQWGAFFLVGLGGRSPQRGVLPPGRIPRYDGRKIPSTTRTVRGK